MTRPKRKPPSPERKALGRIIRLTKNNSQTGCFYQVDCSGPITCSLCQIRRVANRALKRRSK